MKILVTGYKGFVGSNLYNTLKELGHEVKGFDWGDKFPGYDYEVIIHLGAITNTNENNIEKLMVQNYEFSVWLFETCNRYGIKLQYASSAGVYGNSKTFKESDEVFPSTPYAWTKYLFERYIRSKNYSLITQGFRYFNVYGPNEGNKLQPSPFEHFSKVPVIELFEGSENIKRDFIHVKKVVQTHIEFLNVSESGIWNVGTGKATSFLEVAESFNKPIRYIEMPNELRKGYQYYTCADLTKMDETINKYNLNLSLR